MEKVKHLVFDIDGVLIDHNEGNEHHWTRQIENDLGIDRSIVEEIHRDAERWRLLSLGKDKLDTYMNEFMNKHRLSRVNALQIIHYFIKNDAHVRDYMLEEVKTLREKGCYGLHIATHQEPYKGNHLWDVIGFRDHFEYMFTSYDIGFLKTDIEFFQSIQKILKCEAEELLLIDDKKANVETAIKAGWQGHYYRDFETAKKELFNLL